jgi:hypothetical protein
MKIIDLLLLVSLTIMLVSFLVEQLLLKKAKNLNSVILIALKPLLT